MSKLSTITYPLFFIIILLLIFIIIKTCIKKYFQYSVERKLNEILPSYNIDEKDVTKTFNSIIDFDKTFTVDTFKLVKPKKVILDVKQWNDDGFKIYANGKLIVSRKCLKGFFYTKRGCSNTKLCHDKQNGKTVTDKDILYECDGFGGVRSIVLGNKE